MAELSYSKKQIGPLIAKYAINPETNTTFAKIIEMFDGQPNYQLWGVKVIFSGTIKIEELEFIKLWAEENPSLIKHLTKNGNLICYSTKSDFAILRNEIDGLSKIAFVKDMISRFNTDQRKILTSTISPDKLNGVKCHTNPTFVRWYDLFVKFNRLSASTKSCVFNRISAERNKDNIFTLLTQALSEKYKWNKEDLLSFAANNTPDSSIIFDDKSVVIMDVANYKDSNTLCYNRTGWCITSSEGQWKNYVSGNVGNKQYFLFDFSKPECDELAHIAFTVNKDNGITHAHSKTDANMMNQGISYHGKYINIQQALINAGVSLKLFLVNSKKKYEFEWNIDSLLEFVKKHGNDLAISYNKNNRVIVNALTNNGVCMLCVGNFISPERIPISQNSKCYILFDFNLEFQDNNSVVAAYYIKNNYKIDSLNQVWGCYGNNMKSENYFSKIGIKTEDYLDREKVNSAILLHKLIDEGNESEALSLIEKNKDIDINLEFNERRPIFSAIEAKMHRLVGAIIANSNFNCALDDSYGESLIQNLLYTYYLDSTNPLKASDEKNVNEMINTIIDSNKFDLNFIDENEDTAINIAATNPNMNWIVEKLAARKDINVNCKNDIGWTALGNAIRNNNVKAIEFLGKRPDLVISEKDRELAKSNSINLDKYIKPQPFVETTEQTIVTSDVVSADKYNEIFKKVFHS